MMMMMMMMMMGPQDWKRRHFHDMILMGFHLAKNTVPPVTPPPGEKALTKVLLRDYIGEKSLNKVCLVIIITKSGFGLTFHRFQVEDSFRRCEEVLHASAEPCWCCNGQCHRQVRCDFCRREIRVRVKQGDFFLGEVGTLLFLPQALVQWKMASYWKK